MRADAARNRHAILRATEDLLTKHRPDQITIEQVAAAAGVGKGTVFHRFGNRLGLMVELMRERALELEERVTAGPPPLGPGAPPRERLLAFLTAIVEVVGRNKGLLAALGHEVVHDSPRQDHPVYDFWHDHISGQLAAANPHADAALLAHLLLASLHSAPVLELLAGGEGDRLTAALHTLAEGALA